MEQAVDTVHSLKLAKTFYEKRHEKMKETLDEAIVERAKTRRHLDITLEKIKNLEQELDAKNKLVVKLGDQLDEGNLNKAMGKIKDLEDKMLDLELELEEKNKVVWKLSEQVTSAPATQNLHDDVTQLLQKLPIFGQKLTASVEKSIQNIQVHSENAEISSLKSEVSSQTSTIQALEEAETFLAGEVDSKNQLILKLTAQVQEYMAETAKKIADRDQKISEISKKLERAESRIKEAASKKKDESEIQKLRQQLQYTELKLAAQIKMFPKTETKIESELRVELKNMELDVEELRKNAENSEKTCEILRKEVEERKKTIENLENELKNQSGQIDGESSLSSLQNLEYLLKSIDSLKKDNLRLQKLQKIAEKSGISVKNQELESRISSLELQLKKSENRVKHYEQMEEIDREIIQNLENCWRNAKCDNLAYQMLVNPEKELELNAAIRMKLDKVEHELAHFKQIDDVNMEILVKMKSDSENYKTKFEAAQKEILRMEKVALLAEKQAQNSTKLAPELRIAQSKPDFGWVAQAKQTVEDSLNFVADLKNRYPDDDVMASDTLDSRLLFLGEGRENAHWMRKEDFNPSEPAIDYSDSEEDEAEELAEFKRGQLQLQTAAMEYFQLKKKLTASTKESKEANIQKPEDVGSSESKESKTQKSEDVKAPESKNDDVTRKSNDGKCQCEGCTMVY